MSLANSRWLTTSLSGRLGCSYSNVLRSKQEEPAWMDGASLDEQEGLSVTAVLPFARPILRSRLSTSRQYLQPVSRMFSPETDRHHIQCSHLRGASTDRSRANRRMQRGLVRVNRPVRARDWVDGVPVVIGEVISVCEGVRRDLRDRFSKWLALAGVARDLCRNEHLVGARTIGAYCRL